MAEYKFGGSKQSKSPIMDMDTVLQYILIIFIFLIMKSTAEKLKI